MASAFAALGCEVIDCDRVAQEVTNRPDCLTALQSAFGNDVVSEGRLNRALLAERAFSNAVSSKKLNGITHPLIMEEVRRRIAASGKKVVVVDAALLFESGADALCRVTVAVVAEPELRMRRIMRRDRITEVQARAVWGPNSRTHIIPAGLHMLWMGESMPHRFQRKPRSCCTFCCRHPVKRRICNETICENTPSIGCTGCCRGVPFAVGTRLLHAYGVSFGIP